MLYAALRLKNNHVIKTSVLYTVEDEGNSDKETNSGVDKRATVIKVLDTITEETIAKCVRLLEKLSLPSVEATVSE